MQINKFKSTEMKKIIIISISLLATLNLTAQSIQRSVIGSAGKVSTGGAYKISATVGETSTAKYTAGNGTQLRQGFQQPFIVVNSPLPVTWKSFNAFRRSEHEAVLQWELSSEKNCNGFYIEKLQDGEKEFTTIGFVNTLAENGNSEVETNYSYNDFQFNNTKTLYRIKQEDVDGNISYSETKLVLGPGSTDIKMEIWPMPANTTINILLHGISASSQVLILDMNGKVVKSIPIHNQNKVEVNGLANGMYIIQLADNKSISQKIIIQ